MIRALPAGLKVEQAARVFRRSYTLTRRRLVANGYAFREARKYEPPAWALKADWSLPNVDIARKYKLTRERVRQFRKKLKKPKVESRGRKLNHNGKPR